MTSVVLLGDFPSTGVVRKSLATRIPMDGFTRGPAGAFALAQRIEPFALGGRPLLAVYADWQHDEVLPILKMAGKLLPSVRIGRVPLDLPPLALSFVADQLALLSLEVPPGQLAGLAPNLARTVASGAWLSSVAKLEHIETGMRAHVRSYLPGGGFMVTVTPRPEVHRITSSHPVVSWPTRPVDPVLMLVSQQNGDMAWLDKHLRPSLAASLLAEATPPPLSAGYWGTGKYAEFVAWSAHPGSLQAVITATPCRPCSWCGELTALEECAFCFMVRPEAPASAHGLPLLVVTPPIPDLAQPQAPSPAVPQPQPQIEPRPQMLVAPQPQLPEPPRPVAPQPLMAAPVAAVSDLQAWPPPKQPETTLTDLPMPRAPGPVPQSLGKAAAGPTNGTQDASHEPAPYADPYQWYPDQSRRA